MSQFKPTVYIGLLCTLGEGYRCLSIMPSLALKKTLFSFASGHPAQWYRSKACLPGKPAKKTSLLFYYASNLRDAQTLRVQWNNVFGRGDLNSLMKHRPISCGRQNLRKRSKAGEGKDAGGVREVAPASCPAPAPVLLPPFGLSHVAAAAWAKSRQPAVSG